jgi:hypothetical protein
MFINFALTIKGCQAFMAEMLFLLVGPELTHITEQLG